MCEPPTVAGKELLWVPGIVCASHHCASDQGGAGPHHLCEVTCELGEPRVAEVVLADLSGTSKEKQYTSVKPQLLEDLSGTNREKQCTSIKARRRGRDSEAKNQGSACQGRTCFTRL